MGFLMLALFVGVVLFFIMSIVARFSNAKNRRQELGPLAGQLGLEFVELGSLPIPNHDRFVLFSLGREWRSTNIWIQPIVF